MDNNKITQQKIFEAFKILRDAGKSDLEEAIGNNQLAKSDWFKIMLGNLNFAYYAMLEASKSSKRKEDGVDRDD